MQYEMKKCKECGLSYMLTEHATEDKCPICVVGKVPRWPRIASDDAYFKRVL